MPTRNTELLAEIVQALGDLVPNPNEALSRLEQHFENDLLTNAGDIKMVEQHAEKLRLAIITPECGIVLDYLRNTDAVKITIDHVEEAINTLFEDRFIEP